MQISLYSKPSAIPYLLEDLLQRRCRMAFERWMPRRELTRQEEFLMRRLVRTRRLFHFLRE